MANYFDDIKPDPDPEEDRYSVWDEQREEYTSVWDVSRLRRWRRFIEYDWAWKVAGPFYRLRHHILRHFKRCANCGKLGCGPYWFSDTCSEQCSRAHYAYRVAQSRKLHIRSPKEQGRTLCREWIWQKIKVAEWAPERADEFCAECVKHLKRHRWIGKKSGN